MTNPSITTLEDHFERGAVNHALWTSPVDISRSTSTRFVGQVTTEQVSTPFVMSGNGSGSVTVDATTSVNGVVCTQDRGIGSVISYDLTGGGIAAQLLNVDAPPSSSSSAGYFALIGPSSGSNAQSLGWFMNPSSGENVIGPFYGHPDLDYPNGVSPVPYDPSVYRFLSVREKSGVIYWDYSADNVTWTNAASLATPFDVTDLTVSFYNGYYNSTFAFTWGNVSYVLSP